MSQRDVETVETRNSNSDDHEADKNGNMNLIVTIEMLQCWLDSVSRDTEKYLGY